MFKYLKNFLLVLICAFAFQNNAQPAFGTGFDGKYTITIGDQRMTPDKNVDMYATLKKELANNLHEDYYQVLVQFNDKPNLEMKGEWLEKSLQN